MTGVPVSRGRLPDCRKPRREVAEDAVPATAVGVESARMPALKMRLTARAAASEGSRFRMA